MIFTLIVSVLNAAGWISYYIFSGGIYESTETPAVRVSTILIYIICSVVAGLVSFHCIHVFDSFLLNAGHNIMTTAMASAPLILIIRRPMLDPDIGLKQIAICILIYGLAYFFYFAMCIWPTFGMGGGSGLADIALLGGKGLLLGILICAVSLYPSADIGQFIFSCGLMISFPMSIVLAIRSKIID